MSDLPPTTLGTLFFTGTSPFLVANPHFARALVTASAHCEIRASEDIFDAHGLKLWASGRPIDQRLLERLSNRQLRKPIELCVYATDPVACAAIAESIEETLASCVELRELLAPQLEAVLRSVRAVVPSPTELLLLSVMRHGGRDMIRHAALVTALALAAAETVEVHPDLRRHLSRAGIFHDVGELYLAPELFCGTQARSAEQMRTIRDHPMIGARVVVELARSGTSVAHLVAASHERLNGWGYPGGRTGADLSSSQQALLFAEAVAPLLERGANRLRRAGVAARLVPGEFAPEMVHWIGHDAHAHLPEPIASVAASIGMNLRQIHAVLARTLVLLRLPVRETTAALAAAAPWQAAVEAMVRVLRTSGIEEALAQGMVVDPQNTIEEIELSVLAEELLYRLRMLRLRIQMARADTPELGSSALVVDLLHALDAAEPRPDPILSDDKEQLVKILPWSNLFSVGVRAIDEEHKLLVGLLNELGEAQARVAPPELVDKVLQRLIDYVGVHFAHEERLMLENGYTGAPEHLEAHRHLNERVQHMVEQHRQGSSPALDELTIFLRQWLTHHILQTDRDLGAALNARGVR